MEIPDALIDRVELLCLDAGNTIVFFDSRAASEALVAAGFDITAAALDRAHGPAKCALEGRGPAVGRAAPALDDAGIPASWGAFMRTMVELAVGIDRAASARAVRALWEAHRVFNLWRRVPDGLIDAVAAVRAAGVPVCVVSNSEGKLLELFERLGIDRAFDRVLDSHVVGLEKPDPAFFRHALDAFAKRPEHALHLGDVYGTDIVGARAAGLRAALIDADGHYEGHYPDVLRVRDVATVARAIARRGGV